MNIAFPALLIILYLLPGIVFAFGLRASNTLLMGTPMLDWSSLISAGLFVALPLHYLWLTIAELLPLQVTPDIRLALALLLDKNPESIKNSLESIFDYKGYIVSYFSSISIVAFPLGKFAGILMPAAATAFFRPSSLWDIILNKRHKKGGTHVAAAVERGNITYIYHGIYENKVSDEKGMLKGIWLSSARRRPITNDLSHDPDAEEYYPLASDLLYLSMDKIQSYSFRKFRIDPSSEIQKIAHSLWEERKKTGIAGSPDEDWRRAQKLYHHQQRYSKGWRSLCFFAKMRKKEESQIKNMPC